MPQKKIKICWISSTSLLDVDIPIVPKLQSEYDIDWIVLTTTDNQEGDKKLIEATGCNNYRLTIDNGFFFHPKKLLLYFKILTKIKKESFDLIYFDFMGMPYLFPLAQLLIPKEKVVIAAHNVKTPQGARYYWLAKAYMDYVIRTFQNFQVFSSNQMDLLKSLKEKANILYAPLCLKDYGKPSISKPEGPITFLFFGNIVEYKRVDILLDAVKILDSKGIKNFKVIIAGYCRQSKWSEAYQPLISNFEIIKTDIRRIPNEEIPNLFEESHYFVMPYQDIAQSGAMTVALCYNLPIIASDLDTFKEFLNDGLDGYFFKSGDPEKLAERMQFVIQNHASIYDGLREKQAALVKEKLSTEAILRLYRQYINQLCQH